MNRPKLSWWWKVAAAVVAMLIGAGTVLAYRQGQQDNQAKKALAASIENDKRIEAARIERVKQINHVNAVQCESLHNLYSIIRRTIQQSDSNINQISYYRDHPDERARAHMQNAQTLATFRSPPCPKDIVLPNKPVIVTPESP